MQRLEHIDIGLARRNDSDVCIRCVVGDPVQLVEGDVASRSVEPSVPLRALKLLQLRGLITELAREIALQDARRSADEGGSGAHLDETWP